jgi:hypothetical protein
MMRWHILGGETAVECGMSAGVNVHRVGSDLQQRHQIVKHRGARSEDGPVIATNAVTTFATAKCRKVEWPVDVCVGVGKVDILAKRE